MADKKYDPTDGMTTSQKLMAGIGMGMVSAAQFVGNKVGLVSDDTIAERKKLDQALLNTTEGKIGNALGVAAAAVGVAAAGAIAVQSGAAATVGNAALRAGQAAVRLPVQKVQKFVETTKTVANAVRTAPQTIASAARTARQTAAIAREMPLEAAKTVASAAGRGAFKAANLTTKIGGTVLGAQAAISAKEEIGELIDKKEGVSVASIATGAAIVGAAVAGSRLKIAQSAIQSVMSWKGVGLAGTALTSAAVGATAGATILGIDESLSTVVASNLIADMKAGDETAKELTDFVRDIKAAGKDFTPFSRPVLDKEAYAVNPTAALEKLNQQEEAYVAGAIATALDNGLGIFQTYNTTASQLAHADAQALEQQQLADARPAGQESIPEHLPESAPQAPARPTVAFHQQAQKPAHLAHVEPAKPMQTAQAAKPPKTWIDNSQPASPTRPESEAFTNQANAISDAVGGVTNLDTLARALEAMAPQPDHPEPTQLARVSTPQRSHQGPS